MSAAGPVQSARPLLHGGVREAARAPSAGEVSQ